MTDATITRSDDEDGPPTLTVAFSPPLEFNKGTLGGFVLVEPTGRQVREAEKQRTTSAPWAGDIAYEMKLIQLVGRTEDGEGISQIASEAVPVSVLNHCMAFLNEFITAGSEDEDAEDEAEPQAETLTIEPPIKFAGVIYSEIDLREPPGIEVKNARMLMKEPGNLFESRRAQMQLITTVSGLPQPVIDALPIRMINHAGRILGRFTTAGRKTGRR